MFHLARCGPLATALLLLPLVPAAGSQGVVVQGRTTAHVPGSEVERDPTHVEIIWDAWGVPHVFAGSDLGAYYGLGFACARDRLFHIAYERLIANGRLAEFFGRDTGDCTDTCCPDGCPQNCDDCDIYLNHDLRVRAFGYPRLAQRVVADMRPDMLALLQAYADGVNAYAQAPNAVMHPHFATYGIPFEPWTPVDSVAVWLRVARNFGPAEPLNLAGKLTQFEACNLPPPNDPSYPTLFLQCVNGIYPCRVVDDAGTTVTSADANVPPAETQSWLDNLPDPAVGSQTPGAFYRAHYLDPSITFSNAFAVAGNGSGRPAVLVGDPRMPVRVPNSLWEAHMEGHSIEVRGAMFPGTPNFLVGSNRFVAWSVTAAGLEQADLFRLETDPQDPSRYLLDGAYRPFEVDTVDTVLVEEDDGSLTPVPVSYRESVFGPVVTSYVNAADVGVDQEFAVKWVPFHLSIAGAPAGNVQPDVDPSSTRGFFDMYRAPSAETFRKALANWTSPGVNCIFADSGGRAGYSLVGALPVRSRFSPLGGDLAQIGTDTDYDWEAIVPQRFLPWVVREPDPTQVRFVFNANNTPAGLWYPIPLANQGGHTYRSRRLQERLVRLALQGNPTPADVLAIHEDSGWNVARELAILGRWVRDSQGVALDPNASAAVDALALWADADLDFLPDTLTDGFLLGSPERAAASALARWTGLVPFRSPEQGGEVAQWIVDMYGCGDSGFVAFLRDKLTGLQEVPPVDLLPEEVDHVERVLADGWTRNQNVAGATETEWAAWFVDVHLEKQLKRWVDLGGLPSLADPLPGGSCNDPVPPTVCTGPVKAAFAETLLAQFQQAYTQWVLLGPSSVAGNAGLARSLLALGQSEHEGTLHHDDQKTRWEVDYTSSQVLKPQPIDRDQILGTPGSTPPMVLTYDP